MDRKCPNPRSSDLGINIQGVPWEFIPDLNFDTSFYSYILLYS